VHGNYAIGLDVDPPTGAGAGFTCEKRRIASAMDRKRMTSFLNGQVTPFLVERGFHRRGQRYWASRGANSLFIRFQHRGDFFTCDLGVVSALLLAECGAMPPEHWAIRLGPVAVGWDKWWDIADGDEVVAATFLPALARGLDHIEPFATDDGLRDAILHLATTDPRGLAPIEADWLVALGGVVGVPAWAVGTPLRVRDGSVLQLRPRS
jgi:hypothetical protein